LQPTNVGDEPRRYAGYKFTAECRQLIALEAAVGDAPDATIGSLEPMAEC